MAQRSRLIGVRGAPTGPRVDLSQVDTSSVEHNLYILVVPAGETDPKMKLMQKLTLAALQYVHSRLPAFKQMGLDVKVNKITKAQLGNQKLMEAMRKRGMTQLPALTTPTNVYIGLGQIRDVYERNIRAYKAQEGREERAVEGATEEDEENMHAAFYAQEMTAEAAENDADEDAINEVGDMMDRMRLFQEKREKSGPKSSGRPSTTTSTERPRRTGAAPPAPRERPDNVAADPSARRRNQTEDDDEINATIDRLSRDIDSNLRTTATSNGGGDSYGEGEDEQNPHDEMMERAFYTNQQSSDY